MSVKILSNIISSQIDIHRKFGGVFPEHASRAHTEKIIPVIEEALIESIKDKSYKVKKVMKYKNANNFITYNSLLNTIDLVAVTRGPGLIGSLLIGVNAAKTLAYTYEKPIIGINHWLGHIYSNFVGVNQKSNIKNQNDNLKLKNNASSEVKSGSQAPQEGASTIAPVERTSFYDERAEIPQFPALILIASGGHTGLVLMKSHTDIKTIGETLDDAAGEAFDKVAKLLGLGYPGGPAIAAYTAKIRQPKAVPPSAENPKSEIRKLNIQFPRSMLDRKDYNFSFSGLKTSVLYKVKELESQGITINHYKSLIAYEFQQAVIDILIGKTIQAANEFRPKSICLCGGVSANKELRKQFQEKISLINQSSNHPITFHCPAMELSTDNAAMIGIAAAYQISTNKHQLTTYNIIQTDANLRL